MHKSIHVLVHISHLLPPRISLTASNTSHEKAMLIVVYLSNFHTHVFQNINLLHSLIFCRSLMNICCIQEIDSEYPLVHLYVCHHFLLLLEEPSSSDISHTLTKVIGMCPVTCIFWLAFYKWIEMSCSQCWFSSSLKISSSPPTVYS